MTIQLPLSISSARYSFSLSPTHLVSSAAEANDKCSPSQNEALLTSVVYPGGEGDKENPRRQPVPLSRASEYIAILIMYYLTLTTHPSHPLALASPPIPLQARDKEPNLWIKGGGCVHPTNRRCVQRERRQPPCLKVRVSMPQHQS